jgi:hypothetical protein
MVKKVYLAGQANEYDPWRNQFKNLKGYDFYDPSTDSDQSSPETFFPQDLQAIRSANFLVANPTDKPSEGTWIEIGYFYALNTKKPGDFCKKLIIIWNKDRKPWSLEFVKKAGYVVSTISEAVKKLKEISKP